jgi:hypothetical protein
MRAVILSPGTPAKARDGLTDSANMFSEKKYHEILEKSKEKNRYYQEIKEEEEEAHPPLISTERSEADILATDIKYEEVLNLID